MFIIALALVSVASLAFVLINKSKSRKTSINYGQRYTLGTHVVISGGSKGIGKALAKRYAQLGTHVTIIARNETDLRQAKEEIEQHRKNKHVQVVRCVSLDLTKIILPESKTQHDEICLKILGEHERCDILVNCCGSAIATRFEDLTQQQFQYMMDVNYFSAVNLTRILLPVMKARCLAQNGSRIAESSIVFVSSMCGLISFFGYSAYSASKFAIVGLAEALQMELKPFGINVTVAFPPDTDTPGYEIENKSKPSLTFKISESGHIYKPEQVADAIVDDVRLRNFCSTIGLENVAVVKATNAFMPTSSFLTLIFDTLVSGILRLVSYFVLRSWYKLVEAESQGEINRARSALKISKSSPKIDDARR